MSSLNIELMLATEEQANSTSVVSRDTILLRWVNQQLAIAKCPRTLTNFSVDLKV